ncbi:MAG TPA: hypothetical protein VF771_17050 [Longimicrobiaceae bacterium]
MSDTQGADDRSLSEMAERDRRLAAEAAHDADLERPVADGRPDHPHPDIAAADHVRARDDVRTYSRQEELAASQAEAAEDLEDNQRRLYETQQQLARVREEVGERGDDVRSLAGDARELRDQAREVHEATRDIEPPDVER